MDKQRGRPVLVEFWDFCRVNSLRTLPYLKAWHERYADDGLRVIGVHTGGLPARRASPGTSSRRSSGSASSTRSSIDERLELWDFYGNEGWPARYLWDPQGALYSLHYGEGAYGETEREIQALLGRRADARSRRCGPRTPRACCSPRQTEDQPGAYSGPYEAGGVWAVLEGAGEVVVNGRALARRRSRAATRSSSTPHHTAGRARPAGRRRRDLPRHVLHAGGSQLRVAPVAQQPDEPRRPVVLDRATAVPGQ